MRYNLFMLTVGNLLKKAREHSGKQIEEIAQTLRIKPDYLKKIEQNDFSTFNSSTFVKGFIRSYASFLGLDAENVVALFRRQIGEEDVPLKARKTLVRPQSVVISPTTIISLAIIVFFIGIFTFLITQFYRLQQPPEFRIVQPDAPITTVDSPTYEVTGVVEENSLVTVNGSQVQLREDNTFSLTLELREGDNTYSFEAAKKNIDGQKATQVVTLIYIPPGRPTEVQTQAPQSQNPVQESSVTIKTSEDAWIQAIADSTQKAVGVKSKGYSFTFTATTKLEITSGKPNATVVTIDNKQYPWRIRNGVGALVCERQGNTEWKCQE